MELPVYLKGEQLTRLLQGAAVGAIACAAVGFFWGGWQTGSAAKAMAQESSNKAVIAAFVPLCVKNFQSAPDATATMVQLKTIDAWQRDTFITKGGWATFVGKKEPYQGVAEACAKALAN